MMQLLWKRQGRASVLYNRMAQGWVIETGLTAGALRSGAGSLYSSDT